MNDERIDLTALTEGYEASRKLRRFRVWLWLLIGVVWVLMAVNAGLL